ncbi:MAG: DUF6817 domain-containing protein [Planctomycetota bacterium]
MLAQTNLQLYRELAIAGWSSADLTRARAAYDLARELFATAYRPSHKPFVCHLVGTAGALAAWDTKPDVVLAGLLHSTYLFGDFGDGEVGATTRRRRHVTSRVGEHAEAIIHRYTAQRRDAFDSIRDREVSLVRLADRLDEWTDAGPRFSPCKGIDGRLEGEALAAKTLSLAADLVGPVAEQMFARAIAECDASEPDPTLITNDRAFHCVDPGTGSLRRSALGRRIAKLTRKVKKRTSA